MKEETVQVANNIKPTEKKEKKKKETEVPTQGVVNPKGHIPVTTVMGNTTDEDLVFIWQDFSIPLNQKVEYIFKEIGEDNSAYEIPGNEMAYEYEDFIIYTYLDKKETERVKKIEILTENYSTRKGVSYGDYASALKKHYGNPVYQKSNEKHFGSKAKRVIFTYQNNLITELTYEFFPQ